MSTEEQPVADGKRSHLVYQQVLVHEEVSNYGDKHNVGYYTATELHSTGHKRPSDNGYTIEQTPLYVDDAGHVYHLISQVDYYGGSPYMRDDDQVLFRSRPHERHARLLDGTPIVGEMPDGIAATREELNLAAAEKAMRAAKRAVAKAKKAAEEAAS